ncbi:PadR family transcriptional regulator [Knoellia remsis]|uniref:PadR family transcriptional regulator n=1 Tax=Knoellia remsis TaxID=407159 RepID=A0A2T0V0Z5_9MICO|nr:helix-turn-helix transcriptional regulator [Knoellia remsis]PRY63855.1 PadR family transcriptional regulator [Knoellia remsis]
MVASTPRMTGPTRAVLDVLLAAPDADHYGLAIGAATRLPSGTIHPILARLESAGWLTSSWEDIDPSEAGRPRRRLYRLTHDGRAEARAALAAAEARRARLPSPAPSTP